MSVIGIYKKEESVSEKIDEDIAKDAIDTIMPILLELDVGPREKVLDAIKYNSIFCMECASGSIENPNKNCQCWNDN